MTPQDLVKVVLCVAERGWLHAQVRGKNWGAQYLTKGTGHVLTFGRGRCKKRACDPNTPLLPPVTDTFLPSGAPPAREFP